VDLLCVSENATYSVRDPSTGERTVLRLNRPGYHGKAALESEVAWITALRQAGVVQTPAVVPTPRGTTVATLASLASDSSPGAAGSSSRSDRYAVMFTFVDGTAPEPGTLAAGMPVIGEIAARLHEHSRGWTAPAAFTRFSWDLSAALGDERRPARWGDWRSAAGPQLREVLEAAEQQVRRCLGDYGIDHQRFGLIHADLRAANLLVPDTEVTDITVIDFDDCGLSWYAYDLAASVSFLEHSSKLADLVAGWLEGYRRVGAFSGEDVAVLPSLVMLRRLQLLAWSASHADTEMVQSLGAGFADQSARVAERYLSGQLLAGVS
jgi:Ser/Thr protein kinase RdoA (MazF antagonist)